MLNLTKSTQNRNINISFVNIASSVVVVEDIVAVVEDIVVVVAAVAVAEVAWQRSERIHNLQPSDL